MDLKKWEFGTPMGEQITDQNDNLTEIDAKLTEQNANLTRIDTELTEIDAKVLGGKCKDLGQNDNLNDIVNMGMYYNSADINATASNNYPFPQAGLLEVFINGLERGVVFQRYTLYSIHAVYVRVKYADTWQPWRLVSGRFELLQDEIVKSTEQTISFKGAV